MSIAVRTSADETPDAPAQTRRDNHVAIVGLGYVGLPTALSFVEDGHHVTAIDVSTERLDRIRARNVDLSPADHQRLQTAVDSPDFHLTASTADCAAADAVIVCVPTPIDEHLLPDLGPLRTACEQVVAAARPGQLIVLTSTTYVNTTEDLVVRPLAERGLVVGRDVNVAFSPERINPGVTTHALHAVPRVVGGATPTCTERAQALFSRVTDEVHVVSTTQSAELTKLYENTFRAVNISLANEFASVCRELGADVAEVLTAAETKPYGFMRFDPGPGVGGHCIPCDPHYLLWQLRAHRVDMPVVESAMKSIGRRPLEVVERIVELLGARGIRPQGARVLVVGVAYKPDVEDVRESPAIEIISRLVQRGVEVVPCDPHVPHMRLNDGTTLVCRNLTDVDPGEYDLVLVHTRHKADDLSVLGAAPQVLDATYSLDAALPGRVVL